MDSAIIATPVGRLHRTESTATLSSVSWFIAKRSIGRGGRFCPHSPSHSVISAPILIADSKPSPYPLHQLRHRFKAASTIPSWPIPTTKPWAIAS